MISLFLENYQRFREAKLVDRRFKHADILQLIAQFKNPAFCSVSTIGQSVENRDIQALRVGTGKIHVLLWSQMHGNEATATAAIFDILNFFKTEIAQPACSKLLSQLTLHFIPMLNPDGAERFTRRNALEIDLNRDAEAKQMPETQALFAYMQKVKPALGFNLHDQATKYAVGTTNKEATISLLAPEMDAAGSTPAHRLQAMQLICAMNTRLQSLASGHVARYDDRFTPRCVGDQFQKAGISTILVESGACRGDLERQTTRRLTAVAILEGLVTFAEQTAKNFTETDYLNIPVNTERFFDLLIRQITISHKAFTFVVDIGYRFEEETQDRSFISKAKIEDFGDLRAYHGLTEFDASGCSAKFSQGSALSIDNLGDLSILKDERVVAQVRNGKLNKDTK
jgi:hypothetical protein